MSASFRLVTDLLAPAEPVFDLSLDAGFHVRSMAAYRERVVAGPTDRLLTLDDEVTWAARHFGLPFTMTSRIVELERPTWFVDEQVSGPFASFRHEHCFEARGDATRMHDHVMLSAPLGPLGTIAERTFLTRRLRSLIEQRNAHLLRELTT
jgi:ligand-binding SRPBCC domain-containing protein